MAFPNNMAGEQKEKYKNAKIFFRLLSEENMKFDHIKIHENNKTVYCRALQDFSKGYEKRVPRYWNFNTDGVFFNHKQEEIYDNVVLEVVNKVQQGNNAVIFSFGQTGTGKSLTSIGLLTAEKDYGFAPRVLNDLFKFKENSDKSVKVHILMSCIETHRCYFVDLLDQNNALLDHNSLKKISVCKLKTAMQGLSLLQKAHERRRCADNSPYTSHKGNAIFTFHVVQKYIKQSNPMKMTSKLHIVDLAGADTFGNLSCFYKQILDIANGNLAKTQIEQYLLILCEDIPERIHVKQYLNILIRYLSNSFDMHCILRFIGHLRIDRDNLRITISMLRFGQIIGNLRTKQLLTSEVLESGAISVEQLQRKLDELLLEQKLEKMYMNNNILALLNKDRLDQMQHITSEYLQNKTNEVVMLNVTEARVIMKIFKNMFNQYKTEMTELQKSMYDKGYAEAVARMEVTNMKAESTSSVRASKGSRRKSKESVKGKSGKEHRKASKTSSLSKVSEKSIDLSLTTSKEKLPPKQDRKSKESIKQSVKSDKTITDSAIEEVPEGLEDEIIIPKEIPTYETAWEMYINDKTCRYNEHMELVRNVESSAKAIYQEYVKQVKKLQGTAGFLQLAMQKNLQKMRQPDEEKDGIVQDMYDNNFREIQQQITQQQENLLKCEAELKVILETYYNTKKCINKGFDTFCIDKYGTVVPEIKLQEPES